MDKPIDREVVKSVLIEDKPQVEAAELTEDEQKQASQIKAKIFQAQMQRNQPYPEFGAVNYLTFFEQNRNKAHTILAAKKNDAEVVVSAGTLEYKIDAVLSAVQNLNLGPQVRAYDQSNTRIMLAGTALEDTILMTEELDDDEEKQILRQKELLIQGTVFVEERWVKKFKLEKELDNKDYNGEIKDVKWTTRLKKFFEGPTRTVKYGPNVYLGNIMEFEMKNQPYIGLIEVKNYSEVEAIFSGWERWKNVSRHLTPINLEQPGTQTITQSSKVWTINSIGAEQVEVVLYQDKWNNEMQIMLNGQPMLPVGFPLSFISPGGNYTIEKQVLKTYDNFAYGRGFIQSVERASDLLDEMLRLMVLKTRKSFMPPYANTSKRVISARVLYPGTISMGIAADALQQIGKESEGVTNSEFSMMRELSDRIDRQTVSPNFTGQQAKSNTTATEVLELQRQAKMTLGLIIFSCILLEKKIAYLRLHNILENYYKPIESMVLSERAQYRITSRSTNVAGKGLGERQVIPMKGEIPTPKEIRIMEMNEEKKKGYPVEKIFMDPDEMKNNIQSWYIVVDAKEKDTSNTERVMFREELTDLQNMVQFFGAKVNVNGVEEEYSRIFKKDRSKIFADNTQQTPQPAPPGKGMNPNAAKPGNAAAVPTSPPVPAGQ
jgi:hypothetical protein